MAVRRLNHAVLYVNGLERTVEFYRDTLGFESAPCGLDDLTRPYRPSDTLVM